jgi:biopolymer transport protein ExbD
MAREIGYTRVTFITPQPRKPVLSDIAILLSRTGDVLVNGEPVDKKKVRSHLEGLVEEERRAKVRVVLRASRLVALKDVAAMSKLCREIGFKEIVFGVVEE